MGNFGRKVPAQCRRLTMTSMGGGTVGNYCVGFGGEEFCLAVQGDGLVTCGCGEGGKRGENREEQEVVMT